MSSLLNKDKAPFPREVWSELEEAATQALEPKLSARNVVTVSGPHGLDFAAANTGKLDPEGAGEEKGLHWSRREVHPLLEIRVPFSLKRKHLEDIVRGAEAVPLDPLDAAAARVAGFEETAVYQGFPDGAIRGLQESAAHESLKYPDKPEDFPKRVSEGVERLQQAGIAGPYALVLEPDGYFALQHSIATGFPVQRVVEEILGGSVYWSPGIQGGVIVSTRGGDARLTLGQDISMGYTWHDAEEVSLFMFETFTFQVLDPAASIALASRKKSKR